MRTALVLLVALSCSESASSSCPDKGVCIADSGERPTCDPLLQLGCTTGEKCTWLTRGEYIGCAPIGSAQANESCAFAVEGYDNCARGLLCGDESQSTCRVICDLQGVQPPPCVDGTSCVPLSYWLTRDGQHVAGVCR